MSGVIVALIEHPESALGTLAAARNLATLMGGARINVLAVRMPPEAMIMPTEEVLTKHRAAEFRSHERERVRALHAVFEPWAAAARAPKVTTEWVDVEGLADLLVGEWGRRSDFVVISRLSRHAHTPARLAIQAALFDTDRPVLVVPRGRLTPFGERVAIAWRNDKRTERSVLAVLRLLPKAKQVHVLAGMRAGESAPALPEILAEHDIDAVLHILPIGTGVFGETLLHTAHAISADLMVMGAYTHSTWRALILGGVTRYVLAHTDLPVLMRH